MDQKSIGSFIQSLRKEEGLTQKDLGSKIGVTNSTISRWEKGDSYPDAGMYEPLSQALGVSVAELLSGRRMTDREYRKAADEKIISLAQENEQGKSGPKVWYGEDTKHSCLYVRYLRIRKTDTLRCALSGNCNFSSADDRDN